MNLLETFEAGKFLQLCIWFMLPRLASNLGNLSRTELIGNCVLPYKEHLPRTLPITKNSTAEPLRIYVGGIIQNIAPFVASETEFGVNIKFVLKWTDTRLRIEDFCNVTNSNVLLTDEATRLIWLPSPYIVNSKYEEIQKLNRRLISVMLTSTGRVTLTMVVSAIVDCGMNFQWYPMDTQVCPMSIESFLYDDAVVDYNWLQSKPFQVIPRRLLQYDVDRLPKYTKSLSYRNKLARNFTRLTVHFKFVRLWGNYCIQTFIPCTLIVSLSCFSFWLELDAISARAFLLATSMLTLVTQFLGLRAVLPPVAYVTAVDIWMFGCILTIFCAIAEFALVKTLYSITERIRRENLVQVKRPMSSSLSEWSTSNADSQYFKDLNDHLNKVFYPSYKKKRLGSVVLSGRSTATNDLPSRVELPIFFGKICVPLIWNSVSNDADDHHEENEKILLWKQVDMVSKVIFPISFYLFSIAYWIVLVVFGGCTAMET